MVSDLIVSQAPAVIVPPEGAGARDGGWGGAPGQGQDASVSSIPTAPDPRAPPPPPPPSAGPGQGSTPPSAAPSSPPPPSSPSNDRPFRTAVVSSPELVAYMLSFLAGGSRQARREVGHAAVTCRLWREAAFGDPVWGRAAEAVLPVIAMVRERPYC
jgi:hypothetical protein